MCLLRSSRSRLLVSCRVHVSLDEVFYMFAYTVLQLFLSSPKSSLRFAATRTLASLALSHPASVATCNVDLESLISDSNRSVATYAITTLLKVSLPNVNIVQLLLIGPSDR